MYERVSKSSSWTPTSSQKKSKSLYAKPRTSIQPKQENISSQQQEIPTYSTAGVDLVAANIMRGIEATEREQLEAKSEPYQSKSGGLSIADVVMRMPQFPSPAAIPITTASFRMPQEIGVQRQCSECAQETQEQSASEGKNIDEMSLGAGAIQTKLTVGQPGDKYEQEADAVARQVVDKINAPSPQESVQRQSQENALQERQAHASVYRATPRWASEGNISVSPYPPVFVPYAPIFSSVMRHSDSGVSGGASVTQDVEQGIQQARGSGQGLDESVREPMEQAFGADFSGVKVHADNNAEMLNRSISARAFTTGQDIFFKQGEYNPGSRGGQELLAHELTHVVQQTQNQNSIQCNRLGGSSGRGSASPDSEESSRLARLYRTEYVIAHSGSRYTLIPHQPNGRVLYFFYGYESGSATDQATRDGEAPFIEDDVIYAARSGFTVVYDLEGTAGNFAEAIFNPATYGIYWSSHGDMSGNIWTSDNFLVEPDMISQDPRGRQVSPNLRYFILAACGSAQAEEAWQRALPQGCQFEGWLNLTSDAEGIDFTDSALSEELDQLFPHGGLHPDRELRDYIDDVRRESVVDISGN